MSADVRCRGTSASGRWVVTGTVRNVGPASIITTLREATPQRSARLDTLGFVFLSLAIGGLQLMLDRGEQVAVLQRQPGGVQKSVHR